MSLGGFQGQSVTFQVSGLLKLAVMLNIILVIFSVTSGLCLD